MIEFRIVHDTDLTQARIEVIIPSIRTTGEHWNAEEARNVARTLMRLADTADYLEESLRRRIVDPTEPHVG